MVRPQGLLRKSVYDGKIEAIRAFAFALSQMRWRYFLSDWRGPGSECTEAYPS
jgi:hypothetical protein